MSICLCSPVTELPVTIGGLTPDSAEGDGPLSGKRFQASRCRRSPNSACAARRRGSGDCPKTIRCSGCGRGWSGSNGKKTRKRTGRTTTGGRRQLATPPLDFNRVMEECQSSAESPGNTPDPQHPALCRCPVFSAEKTARQRHPPTGLFRGFSSTRSPNSPD